MTVKPWTMDNIRSGVETHSMTIAALNADIQTLTAAKDSIEIAPLKIAFGSVIDVLGLTRVRVSFCPFSRMPLDDAPRTRWQTTIPL